MEMPRIGCYDSAERGEFRRHRDNTTPYTAHRKFAISVNLNSGYEGGAVGFPEYGRKVYVPPPGGGVIFSCSLLHEAQPVTKGRRFGLFTFLTDAEGAKREKEMVAKYGNQLNRYSLK
jgi:predicted 2-oxoglutarate/Fe(II)-dependent dioxygenase YbiX